jgi:hypothetical protein
MFCPDLIPNISYLKSFLKRKNGLFKKAYELGVLCSVDVAVIILGKHRLSFVFSTMLNALDLFLSSFRGSSWS